MTGGNIYFGRAGRAGDGDMLIRAPELECLREKSIAVFGAGCLGAPSILEFARAGVGDVRILDGDVVEPGTVGRWPFGLSAAGLAKVGVLAEFLGRNYPATRVTPYCRRIGAVRRGTEEEPSDQEIVGQMTAGVSLIYDATAEVGVQRYLSGVAEEVGVPYVAVDGTFGGWGGKILSLVGNRTEGCWICYRLSLEDETISPPPSQPKGEIQQQGCGDVTFRAAGFDMSQIALTAVRTAVSLLCAGVEGGYPTADWDVMTVAFRDEEGELIAPQFVSYNLPKHPRCPACNSQ